MSVGVTVGCKFTCAIGKRKATFEIWGGDSSSPNRDVKGGCVDASGVEVHEGISDCLSCFQPRRFSPDSCILCPGLANHKDGFPPLSVKYQAGSFAMSARQASHNFPSVLAGCRESGIFWKK